MTSHNSNDNQQQQGHERQQQPVQYEPQQLSYTPNHQTINNESIYPHMMVMSNECNDTVTSKDDIEMQQHLHTQQRRHEQHPSIISDESLSSISTTMTSVSLDQQQQQGQQTQPLQQQQQVQQRFGLEIANITDSNSFFTYSDNSSSSRDSCNIGSTNQTSRDYANHDDDNILSRKYIQTNTDNITDNNSMIDTITTCTTSTTNENRNGNVPLHDMIYNFPINALNDPSRIQYYEEQIRVEAQLHPEHVNMYNHDGYTPFHIACYIGISYRIIVDLINIWPSVVTTPTQPLSLLLKSKPKTQQDKLITGTRRRRSRSRHHQQHRNRSPTLSSLSITSMLPLHIVSRYCSNNSLVQYQIINLLVRIYPEATKIWTNNSSIIDIDHAFVGRSSSNDTTPDEISTIAVPDDESYGDLPIHLYCQNTFGNNLRIIQLLVKTYPTSIQLFNRNGQLPIHIVCERHYFQRLDNNKKYNAMIQKTTTNETKASTDIHCCTSYEILQYLISIYPKSIMIHDNKRNEIPFVTALRCKQPINTLEYLISLYPQATSCVDYKNRTPLHRYCNMIQNQMYTNHNNKKHMMIDDQHDGIEQDQYNYNVLQLLLQYDDTNKVAGTIVDDQNYIPIQYLLLISSSSSSIRRQNDDKNNSNNLSLLNIIYMLLRHYPNSIATLRTNIIETKK